MQDCLERGCPPFALAKQKILGFIDLFSQVAAAAQVGVIRLHYSQMSFPDFLLTRCLSGSQNLGSLALCHLLQESTLQA